MAHHPQAIYFGTRQGRLPLDGSPDDVIKGSYRDASLPDFDGIRERGEQDPPDGVVESEEPSPGTDSSGEPAMAGKPGE